MASDETYKKFYNKICPKKEFDVYGRIEISKFMHVINKIMLKNNRQLNVHNLIEIGSKLNKSELIVIDEYINVYKDYDDDKLLKFSPNDYCSINSYNHFEFIKKGNMIIFIMLNI